MPPLSSHEAATPGASTERPPARPRTLAFIACAALALVPGLAKLGNGYALDDEPILTAGVISDLANLPRALVENAMFAAGKPGGAIDTYRPLSIATFFWDYALSGPHPLSYHLTNAVAHAAVVVLALALTLRLVPTAGPLACAAAALFVGLHPAGAEAHVWINGRSDVFMTLAGLLSFGALLVARDPSERPRRRTLAAVAVPVLTLVACLFKETWVMALPCYWIVDRLVLSRNATSPPARSPNAVSTVPSLRALPWLGPLAGIAAYAGLRWVVLDGARAGERSLLGDAFQRLGVIWLDGLRTLIAPSRISMRVLRDDYADLGSLAFVFGFAGAFAVVAFVAAFTLRVRRVHPVHLALVALGAFLLPIPLIAVSGWPGFHRYLYAPIALSAPLVALCVQAVGRPALQRALVVGLGVTFAVQSLRVAGSYRDMTSFAEAILAENPRVPIAWDILGQQALHAGDRALAAECFERAVRSGPPTCPTLERLALTRVLLGQPQVGVEIAERAIASECPSATLRNVAAMGWLSFDPERTVARIWDCLHLDPDAVDCTRNLQRWCTDHPGAPMLRSIVERTQAERPVSATVRDRIAACFTPPSSPPTPPPSPP